MAQQVIERADPRPRNYVPGQAGQLKAGTTQANRKYLLANPADNLQGLTFHLDTGWHKVNGKKDGDPERVISGKVEANGDVTFQGQVLIWIELEEWEAREEYKRQAMAAREARKAAPGGLDGVMSAEGEPATEWKGQ
jgi:hypothetical protein